MFQPGCPQDILPTAFALWNFGLRCLGLQHWPWLQRSQSHGKAIGVPFLNIIDTGLMTPKNPLRATLSQAYAKDIKTPLQNTCLILSHGVAIAENLPAWSKRCLWPGRLLTSHKIHGPFVKLGVAKISSIYMHLYTPPLWNIRTDSDALKLLKKVEDVKAVKNS